MHVIWIFILTIVHFCYAGDITCTNYQDPNCFRKTINCVSDGKNCTVNCNANQACRNSIINCAPSVGCFVYCSKYQSCQNVVINGGSAVTLSVHTANAISLALNDAEINCQNTAYCDVTCTENRYQCRNAKIKAENSGQLIVRCEGNSQSTDHCQGMHIFCPKTQPKCWIFSPIVLAQVDIYSQLGFDGVAICGDANSNSIGNMHCGSEYNTTCPIHAFSDNYCDAQSLCDSKNVFSAETHCNPPAPTTSNPTRGPTQISAIPTINPTLIPTLIPSDQPTIHPTNNFILTTYPSYEDIKYVTKTVMILAQNTSPIVSFVGFAAVASLLVLVCCVMICIIAIVYIKMHNKSNVTVSNNNLNANELQQLTIPTNHGLVLFKTGGTNEGNGQYIAKINDETQDCNGKYEGTNTKPETFQIVRVQKEKQLLDENIIGVIGDDEDNLGLYGPGAGNQKTHGDKNAN